MNIANFTETDIRYHATEKSFNRGKAESYQDAVNWLTKARTAYLQSGRQHEWQEYRNQLVDTHGRKHKLMGLIDAKL